jgi:hypothetical protein
MAYVRNDIKINSVCSSLICPGKCLARDFICNDVESQNYITGEFFSGSHVTYLQIMLMARLKNTKIFKVMKCLNLLYLISHFAKDLCSIAGNNFVIKNINNPYELKFKVIIHCLKSYEGNE